MTEARRKAVFLSASSFLLRSSFELRAQGWASPRRNRPRHGWLRSRRHGRAPEGHAHTTEYIELTEIRNANVTREAAETDSARLRRQVHHDGFPINCDRVDCRLSQLRPSLETGCCRRARSIHPRRAAAVDRSRCVPVRGVVNVAVDSQPRNFDLDSPGADPQGNAGRSGAIGRTGPSGKQSAPLTAASSCRSNVEISS